MFAVPGDLEAEACAGFFPGAFSGRIPLSLNGGLPFAVGDEPLHAVSSQILPFFEYGSYLDDFLLLSFKTWASMRLTGCCHE